MHLAPSLPKAQDADDCAGKFSINVISPKKKKGQRRLDRVPKQYKVYIKSQHWQNRKNRYYQANGRRCAVCNSASSTYITRSMATTAASGMKTWCHSARSHHEAFHQRYGVRGNMKTDTDIFVATALCSFDEQAATVVKNL